MVKMLLRFKDIAVFELALVHLEGSFFIIKKKYLKKEVLKNIQHY